MCCAQAGAGLTLIYTLPESTCFLCLRMCHICTCSTVQLVRRSGLATRVLRSGRGRAVQMNAGADAATSDMLCFLHADTQPPKDLVSHMLLLL
jgi:cellulose synthase/poly-beta-1,6-N-acetylglucosamine synthase-like glycosyltransferase